MTFDWNASYEWLAEEFRKETGLMAPAKDDPLCDDMNKRRREWNKWFESRNEQAWREWHERHGMLAARSAGAQEPIYQVRRNGMDKWIDVTHEAYELRNYGQYERRIVYTHPQPIPQTDAARERPSVVLAYSTKGHNKPCGQTMGANGCGEFVTVYYGDIDAAERSARDRICNLEKAGHRFNWAIVMRADEEAYLGPAMTFEEIERGEREGDA